MERVSFVSSAAWEVWGPGAGLGQPDQPAPEATLQGPSCPDGFLLLQAQYSFVHLIQSGLLASVQAGRGRRQGLLTSPAGTGLTRKAGPRYCALSPHDRVCSRGSSSSSSS